MRASPYIVASSLLAFSLARSIHQHGPENFLNQPRQALLQKNLLEISQSTKSDCTTGCNTLYGEPTIIQLAEDDTTTAEVSTAVHASSHLITNAPETPTAVSSPAAIHHAPIHVYKPAVPAQPPPPEFAQPTPPLAKSAPAAAHARKPASRPSTSHASPHDNTSDSPWCITYSPYTASGNCKSSSAISSDVASIASKGFSSIRIYSTDCNGLPIIAAAAAAHNLNLVLGVYIPAEGIPAARPQIQEIIEWATSSSSSSSPPQTTTDSWQNIEMIVIGNEAIFNAHCSAASLAAFITEARRAFRAAGYPGPITTAEPLAILSRFPHTLCPVSDVLAANIHPFFNPDVLAHQAGAFVAAQLALLRDVCPGGEEKEAYVLETGWPSRGAPNGRAVPGGWEQRVAVEAIRRSEAGGKSAFFGFVDDEWKDGGEWGVERSFGCGGLFG